MSSLPIIYLPISNLRDAFFRHAGDTFRELAGLWETDGLVEIVYTDTPYCWLHATDSPQGILLYDRPTMDWWTRTRPSLYRMALFGNYVPPQSSVPRALPWTFWGRHPALMASFEKHPLKTYEARTNNCVFIGKVENQVQQHFRRQHNWSSAVDDYTLVNGKTNPYTPREYLEHLSDAKFGLSLRGFGPKCNREIELLLFGTVPIVAPDCDMKGYYDPLVEGVHYFVAANPSQVIDIIKSTSKSKWEEMSRNGRDWYIRNASSKGSFYQTMRLISTVNTSSLAPRNPKPLIFANSVSPKLPNTKRILIDMVFFDRPLSGISRVWTSLLRRLGQFISKDLFLDNSNAKTAFEYVLLLRENSTVPADITKRFAYIGGIKAFSYADHDVQHMNQICQTFNGDFFISTYYTYATVIPCIVLIHDMIPEIFNFPIDAMWEQKKQCLQNGSHFISVSDASKNDFIRFYPEKRDQIGVVHNSFDPAIFQAAQEILKSSENIRQVHQKLSVPHDEPFVLTIIGNGNGYKNFKLVLEALHHPENPIQNLVIVANVSRLSIQRPPNVNIILLNNLSDTELGVLYGTAHAFVYPSRYEGFGLPILEAFYFMCPVVCCKDAGGTGDIITESGYQTLVWSVEFNRPDQLIQHMKFLLSTDTNSKEIDHRIKNGLLRLNKFTLEHQIISWRDYMQKIFEPKEKMLLKNITKTNIEMSEENNTITEEPISEPEEPISEPVEPVSEPIEVPPGNVCLLIQYFNCENADRQAEYDFCVQANLDNPNVTEVHNMVESETVVPDWFKNHEKYREFTVLSRLTYKTAIDYANKFLVGRTVALANLDIFLDHATKWGGVKGLNEMGIILCLARHEFDGEGSSSKDKNLDNLAYATAQDCWVFQAPIHVKECDFSIGMLGCDSAIAQRFHASGYLPINAQDDYKIHHYDLCRGKTGANFTGHHQPNLERPEDRGYRLLPGFNRIQSIDKLIEGLKLGEVHRYLIISDIMSNYIRLNNPK